MANPHIAVIRLTESGSFDPDVRDTLIVGPGMGTSVNGLFTETAQQLTNHFQVIGFDLPGHGQSPAHNEAISIEELPTRSPNWCKTAPDRHHPWDSKCISPAYPSPARLCCTSTEHAELFDGIAVLASAPKIGTKPTGMNELIWSKPPTEAMVDMSAQLWSPRTRQLGQTRGAKTSHDQRRRPIIRCTVPSIRNYDVTDRLHEISVPIPPWPADKIRCAPWLMLKTRRDGPTGTSAVIDQAAHLLAVRTTAAASNAARE